MDSSSVCETLNLLRIELQNSMQRITEINDDIVAAEPEEQMKLRIAMLCEAAFAVLLVVQFTEISVSIINALMPPQYICIASTFDEKINWFLDNEIYKKQTPFTPTLKEIENPKYKIYQLSNGQ